MPAIWLALLYEYIRNWELRIHVMTVDVMM